MTIRASSRIALLALLAACSEVTSAPDAGDRDADPVDAPSDAGDIGAPDAGDEPIVDCTRPAALPAQFSMIVGPIHAEDFAFDDQGNMVSGDPQGNLIKSDKQGNLQVWVPNATSGEGLAGTRYLPNGDLVFASTDDGTLFRVTANGATTPVLGGFEYPNGIEVDLDGIVYVAEQAGGRVRRVDPMTGSFDFVATDMHNPNGLSFSPDYRTLYVGSFGDGTIHAIDFDSVGTPSPPRLFALTPHAPGPNSFPTFEELAKACTGLSLGDPCPVPYYLEHGLSPTCSDDLAGGLYCYAEEPWPDVEAPCAGRAIGDACEVRYIGEIYLGTCQTDSVGTVSCITDTPIGGEGTYGGLDGLAVDACGYVYVCEFTVGVVWRISPDGSRVEEVFKASTGWIPNMQWGTGAGGWDRNTLYVIDRMPDLTYEVLIDTPGKSVAFP